MIDQLTTIDEQINRLKKKKERVQTQQAITFMREAQKIFQTDFSPDIALSILSETWRTASEKQQAEWKKRARDFRHSSIQSSSKKPQPVEPAHQQS
jgi:ABC-type transporter MlaC component